MSQGNYKPLRCPECRTRRVDPHLMVLHRLHCERAVCTCGGYHYKHRHGSTLCVHNPRSVLIVAQQHGASADELADLMAEVAFTSKGTRATTCPF